MYHGFQILSSITVFNFDNNKNIKSAYQNDFRFDYRNKSHIKMYHNRNCYINLCYFLIKQMQSWWAYNTYVKSCKSLSFEWYSVFLHKGCMSIEL